MHHPEYNALYTLLQRIHDIMDARNAIEHVDEATCMWCGMTGYDGNGLMHLENCILLEIRALVSV